MDLGQEKSGPIVRIEGLCKNFGTVRAVDDLSFCVEAGEFFALLGPSGCGKTSLLRLIAGFERPDRGRIVIAGQDMTHVPPHQRPINMMFQSYALFPHMDVAHNIAFGLVEQGLAKPEIGTRVAEMLRLVQLEGLERRKPEQLSGGQKQRVGLARALARRPAILLLDEPLAALDKNLREETQIELVALQARLKTTFIVVTHDQREAMVLSQRLAVMREGRFAQIGTPEAIYERPQSRYVAEFVGEINLIDGHVVGSENGRQKIATAAGLTEILACQDYAEGTRVFLALRPERLHLSALAPVDQSRMNNFIGTITGRSYRGDSTLFDIMLGCGAKIRAMRQNLGPGGEALEIGAKVGIAFGADAGIVLTS